VHGIDAIADEEEDLGPVVRQRFAEAEGSVEVESYTLAGFGHATPIDPDAAEEACGQDGEPFILDANICSTHAIARFFGLAGAAPTVTIDAAEMDSGAIVVSGSAEDPAGAPPAVTVRLDGPFTSHEQSATSGASWSARVEGLTDNTPYRPIATAVDADGLVAVGTGPLVELGHSPANQPPAIEIAASVVAGDCVRVELVDADFAGRLELLRQLLHAGLCNVPIRVGRARHGGPPGLHQHLTPLVAALVLQACKRGYDVGVLFRLFEADRDQRRDDLEARLIGGHLPRRAAGYPAAPRESNN
jgi:hypothetical protein